MIERAHLEKISYTENEDGREYTLTYLIRTSKPTYGPQSIASDPKFPYAAGSYYAWGDDSDPSAILREVKTDPVDKNRFDWISVLKFATDENETPDQSPLLDPPTYEWLFNNGERPIERDIHNKPIRNTANDRFDEILAVEDSQPILKITRNEAVDQLMYGFDMRDCVNRSPWLGAPRRTVKFQPPRAVSKVSSKWGEYYEKSYEFKFSDQTWRLVMLNQGLNEVKTTGTGANLKRKLVRMKDGEGNDITEPNALDNDGKKLADGQPPIWLEFDGYREIDFPDF